MPYTSQQFERVIRKNGLTPIARRHLKEQIYLYTAEGEKRPNEEMDVPHWVIIWAAGFDDQLQFGQYIRVPTHITMPETRITVPTSREDRVKLAEAQAHKLIEAANNVDLWNA